MATWQRWGLTNNPFFQDELTSGPKAAHPVERLLVGRRAELQRARTIFEDETSARCIVEGDPGIGKTSFVNRIKADLIKSDPVRAEIDGILISSETTARDVTAEALRVVLRLREEEMEGAKKGLVQKIGDLARSEQREAKAFWEDVTSRVLSKSSTAHGVTLGNAAMQGGYSHQRSRQVADEGAGPLHQLFREAVKRFYHEWGRSILFHVDNVELLGGGQAETAATVVQELRPCYTAAHSHWVFVGTNGIDRTIFRARTQTGGYFQDSIRLAHLTSTEVRDALAERYQHLKQGTRSYIAPVALEAAAELYTRYEGDLRNFLRMLEQATTAMSGTSAPQSLEAADVRGRITPRYWERLVSDVGAVVATHFKHTVRGASGRVAVPVLREFRQKDMQDRAEVKGPATQAAMKALIEAQYIHFVRSDGPSKYYRITGDAAMALDAAA